ncbi:CU044_2847 family protein [Streptomyces sp. NPDC001389]|uniref:CU044_2847 family protein n=1 Tax=Streptomyces sp. NPDC001389 TaxID=3364569 RepID=UPI003695366F
MTSTEDISENIGLDDGSTVRFLLSGAAGAAPERGEGLGPVVPVGRRADAVAAFATDALRATLKPLGVLVREVHSSMTSVPVPPTEITVTFGIQLTQDLQLGIVSGNNQAHLTVTASWTPPAGG